MSGYTIIFSASFPVEKSLSAEPVFLSNGQSQRAAGIGHAVASHVHGAPEHQRNRDHGETNIREPHDPDHDRNRSQVIRHPLDPEDPDAGG